jgi:O-antigen/teichoic acid export membrane protein
VTERTPPGGDAAGIPDIAAAAFEGVRWLGAARAVVEVAAFGSSVLLAHLLVPAQFGRGVVVLALIAVLGALFSEGFTTPLVQRAVVTDEHLRAAQLLSLVLGAAVGLLVLLVVPTVLSGLIDHETGRLSMLLAPASVVFSLSAVSRSMLQRRLDFRTLGLLELVPSLVGVPLTIGLALGGLGAASLVLGILGGSLVQSIASLRIARPPRPGWLPAAALELATFGAPAALASLTYTGGRQLQFMVLGAGLGPKQVGLFWRAYQLGNDYQGKVSGIMLRLALPLYSRTSGQTEMKRIRGRIVRVHAVALIPFLALLAVSAPELIPLLYGHRWEAAVLPTQILAIGGIAAVVNTGVGPLLVAAGHPKRLLATNVVLLVALLAALLVTMPLGLVAVCIGVAVAQLVGFAYVHWLVLPRAIGLSPRGLVQEVGPAIASSVVLAVAGEAAAIGLRGLEAPSWIVLLATVAVAGTAYALTLRGVFRAAWNDMWMLVDRSVLTRRPRLRAAGARVH